MNPSCVGGVACELDATAFGACADCHAPGIDGVLGGRSLLEAAGFALQALVNTLYPAYIVFNAVKRLRSSDRLDEPMQRRFVALLAASCVAASLYASRKRAKTG